MKPRWHSNEKPWGGVEKVCNNKPAKNCASAVGNYVSDVMVHKADKTGLAFPPICPNRTHHVASAAKSPSQTTK